MRELIGTKLTADPGVIKSVYRSELVYCCECRKTVPVGIEVITTKKDRDSQTVLRHENYCRLHGMEYETMTHRHLASSNIKSKSDNDAYLHNYCKKR
jgi:hypothetical protein